MGAVQWPRVIITMSLILQNRERHGMGSERCLCLSLAEQRVGRDRRQETSEKESGSKSVQQAGNS